MAKIVEAEERLKNLESNEINIPTQDEIDRIEQTDFKIERLGGTIYKTYRLYEKPIP